MKATEAQAPFGSLPHSDGPDQMASFLGVSASTFVGVCPVNRSRDGVISP